MNKILDMIEPPFCLHRQLALYIILNHPDKMATKNKGKCQNLGNLIIFAIDKVYNIDIELGLQCLAMDKQEG